MEMYHGMILHHPELSQTNGEIDGRWVFGNANNTPRVARIDLKTFRTEIIELPNSAGNHSSPFATENTEYVVLVLVSACLRMMSMAMFQLAPTNKF
jgi:nitrous oxide reductase